MMSAQILVPGETETNKQGGGIGASAALAEAVTVGSMGIMGAIKQNIGNMTAMGVICMVFVWQLRDAATMAREDRMLFREAVEKIETRQEARSVRAEMTHGKAFDKMGVTIERAVTSLEKATDVMTRTPHSP